jgi:hypothetical protein
MALLLSCTCALCFCHVADVLCCLPYDCTGACVLVNACMLLWLHVFAAASMIAVSRALLVAQNPAYPLRLLRLPGLSATCCALLSVSFSALAIEFSYMLFASLLLSTAG